MAKLSMTAQQAAGEIAVLADRLRQGANSRDIADRLSHLVDRLEGADPLPRLKSDIPVIMATRGRTRRVQVQTVRPAFGLGC